MGRKAFPCPRYEEITKSLVRRYTIARINKLTGMLVRVFPDHVVCGLLTDIVAHGGVPPYSFDITKEDAKRFEVFFCPLEDVPLHMGSVYDSWKVIASWRLEIGV